MFVISLICLVLLFMVAVKVGVFTGFNLNAVFMTIISILQNTYVSSVLCSVFTVLIIYFAQVQYSKTMLKKDFRCNEIIQDIYSGIQSYNDFLDKIPQQQERKSDEDFFEKQKKDALMFYEFYKKNKVAVDIINLNLSFPNNDLLIDSVQSCFFINLNFKFLNIINNIKNRLPNLRNRYPEIEEIYKKYEDEIGNKELIDLGDKLPSYFVDLRFMATYWKELLDYIGYDPTYINMFIKIYNSKYDIEEDIKLSIETRDKRDKEINKAVKKAMRQYRIKHFWDK